MRAKIGKHRKALHAKAPGTYLLSRRARLW